MQKKIVDCKFTVMKHAKDGDPSITFIVSCAAKWQDGTVSFGNAKTKTDVVAAQRRAFNKATKSQPETI
jgi:hypothetical protein